MAFTLSASQTIDSVTGSYEVTGSGNLDDLATACSGIGMSRKDNAITFNPGAARILAISGTLTDQRDGVYNVRIMGSGHICWGYASGSAVILGKTPEASGFSKSVVNISYDNDARAWGDAFNSARGKCIIGLGAFTHNSGSFDVRGLNNSTTLVFDIWKSESGGAVYFDDVAIYGLHNHFYMRTNVQTTSKTLFTLEPTTTGGKMLEVADIFTEVKPVATTNGLLMLSIPASTTCRFLKPNYPKLCSYNGNATGKLVVVDPATTYMANDERQESEVTPRSSLMDVTRTVNTSFKDAQFGTSLTSCKAVVMKGATPSVINFDSTTAIELLQSSKSHGTKHYANGTGWTDSTQNPYPIYLVAYGYASNRSINVKTEHDGNNGVPWAATDTKSPLVTTAYASVVTTPFSFVTTGNGTLTLSSAATSKQVAEYLFKQAYDNADVAYWRGLNHKPATGTADSISIGAINLTLNSILSGAILSTTGNITIGASGMPTAPVSGAVITVGGTNTAILNASTRIDGLATAGTISTGGKLGLGSGTTINATGDLIIDSTELSGTLTINASAARILILKNCTGQLTGINATGTGSLQVKISGSTVAAITGTLGAGVTKGVLVKVADAAGGAFTVYAVRGDTGAKISFNPDVSIAEFFIEQGVSVKISAWKLGKNTFYKEIATTSGGSDNLIDFINNESINTTLDVSTITPNIDVALATNDLSATFNAAMVIDIETIKTALHRIFSRETSLSAAVLAGATPIIEILTDEIRVNHPTFYINAAMSLAATERVDINAFFNTTNAKKVNSAYVINPSNSAGKFVQILPVKPAVDYALLAAAVSAKVNQPRMTKG